MVEHSLYLAVKRRGVHIVLLREFRQQKERIVLTAQPRHFAVLAIQDVDDRMCRELANAKRDMQMAAILRSRFRTLTTVYLDSGQCERMDLNRSPGAEKIVTGDYTYYTQNAMEHGVHPEDKNAMWSVLSLEHLRDKAEIGRASCRERVF